MEEARDVRSMDAGADAGPASRGAVGGAAEWQRFESLLVELSAAFVNLPADQVDAEITRWLQRIAESLDIDRSVLAQLDADTGDLRITHSWTRPGWPPIGAMIPREVAPWMVAKIQAGEVVVIPRLDDLPPEASRDKDTALRIGTKSNVTVPLTVGGSVIGGLTFGSLRRERSWPENLVKRFQLVGQVFTNALQRKRAHEQIEELVEFERLMSQLSATLINLPIEAIDQEIEKGVQRSAEFLGMDRATIYWFLGSEAV